MGVVDEFNYGLSRREVIYRAHEGCYPQLPVVDWKNYQGEPISLNGNQPEALKDALQSIEISVGAIVVATGFGKDMSFHLQLRVSYQPARISVRRSKSGT